jgi:peptide/nickel transport system substrate-binding protein
MTDDRDEHAVGDTSVSLTRRQLLRRTALGGVALAVGGTGLGRLGADAAFAAPAMPRRGGNLRVAILGGSSADTLDAGKEVTQPDAIRVMALYNGLVRLDTNAHVTMDLAEEFIPSKDARTWRIHLKKGVEFHNGKEFTAEDVIFTLRRIANPKAPLNGANALKPIDRNAMRAVDKHTVELRMHQPYASFVDQISAIYNFGVVPVGYDPKHPIGTGPFKFKSFTPGQQSVFVGNPNYFKHGLPYLDTLTIIDSFASDTAAFNALQGGQVDIYTQAPFVLANQVNGTSIKKLVSKPGQWTPFTMRVDKAPFSDVRVRQAFRLIVNRKQYIQLALNGFGGIGNDVFSQWDPAYDHSLHRDQDLGKAKALLKRAGHEKLSVTLVTADIAAGVLQGAQVFAQQAKAAGVDVRVKQVPVGTFYGPSYLTWPFAQDFWAYSPYLSQVAQGSLKDSPFNETHWNDPTYNKLYAQANATTNNAKRREIIHEMERIDFARGGYIIPAYNKQLDLLSTRVNGFVPAGTGVPLGNAGWESAWLA